MTQVDSLLYRPWSDDSRRGVPEQPVDFSKKSLSTFGGAVEAETKLTDIDEVSASESDEYTRKEEVCLQTGNIKTSDHVNVKSRTPDSGFSSPSESSYLSASAYHHWLPGLYQQALANHHAIRREAFCREAIQRGLFSSQSSPVEKNGDSDEQLAPLALVVKRKYSETTTSNEEDEDASERKPKRLATEEDYCKLDKNSNCTDLVPLSAGCDDNLAVNSKNEESLKQELPEGEYCNTKVVVPVPTQTSPFHLLPPSLYWPHGSTPMGEALNSKQLLTSHFENAVNPSMEHLLNKSLARPQPSPESTKFTAVSQPPVQSPMRIHLSNTLTNPLTSPLTSPVARAAYNLSISMNNAVTGGYGDFFNKTATCQASPTHLSTPAKSPAKSPSSSLSAKRKISNGLSPEKKGKTPKKNKATRRLNFDEDKTSPVSGTIIRELVDGEEPLVVRKGDIDPAYNVVEVTEEAKAEIAKIENKIGDYVCRLCKELYDDAFGLAQHRCSRIIHVEYRCPECDKVFNCPANLASHRRWHKPKTSGAGPVKNNPEQNKQSATGNCAANNNVIDCMPSTSKGVRCYADDAHEEDNNNNITEEKETGEAYECAICFKSFKRQAYLRKHLSTHRREADEQQATPDTVLQPIPQKHGLGLSAPIPRHISPSLSQPPHHAQFPHMSPLTPPMLSPPFSPTEIFKCHLCHSSFFSPTALTIHFATSHRRDPRGDSSATSPFPTSREFVEFALGSMSAAAAASNSGPLVSGGLHVPRPQYLQPPQSVNHLANHLLHRPSQISATS